MKPPNGSLSSHDVNILYKMLLEMGHILNDQTSAVNGNTNSNKKEELLKKVTVQGGTGNDISYCMGVSKDGLVYIVKKRSDA